MTFATMCYRLRRLVWHARRGGAVREFLRRRRLNRSGESPQTKRGCTYPLWPLPPAGERAPVNVALIAPESVGKALGYEWNSTLLKKASWRENLTAGADLLVVTSSAGALPMWEVVPDAVQAAADLGITTVLCLDAPADIPAELRTAFDVVTDIDPAVSPMLHNPRSITKKGRVVPRRGAIPLKQIERLPLQEVLSAYRSHAAFTVGSEDNPALQSKFEALACGAAIESETGGLHTGNESLNDREWEAYIARQKLWLSGTYRHRVNELLERVSLAERALDTYSVTPLIATMRPEQLPHIIDYLACQRGVEIQPIISTHGFEVSAKERQLALDSGLNVTWLSHDRSVSLGNMYNAMLERADTQFVAKMDDDDFYDSSYLLDSALALNYSGAGVVGKRATFVYLEGQGATYLCFGADENRFVHEVAGPTLFCSTDLARTTCFSDLSRGEDSDFLKRAAAAGAAIYAGSRFGFVRMRSQSSHTWNVGDSVFTANGVKAHAGGPTALELPGRHGLL